MVVNFPPLPSKLRLIGLSVGWVTFLLESLNHLQLNSRCGEEICEQARELMSQSSTGISFPLSSYCFPVFPL